jgi:hypothetical protein
MESILDSQVPDSFAFLDFLKGSSQFDWGVLEAATEEAWRAPDEDERADIEDNISLEEAASWTRDDPQFINDLRAFDTFRAPPSAQKSSSASPSTSAVSTPTTLSPLSTPSGTPQASDDESDAESEWEGGSMVPPPIKSYPTRDALKDDVQAWAKQHGYAVVTRESNKKKLILICDRGGKPRKRKILLEDLKRQASTRKCGCKWRVRGYFHISGLWKLKIVNPNHKNHGPSSHPSAHPVHRRQAMKDLDLDQIDSMIEAGAFPAQILSAIC